MTDGTPNSPAAGVTAVEEYVVEGDGAPASVVANVQSEQPGEGQAGQAGAQAEQKGAEPAKAAVTLDPAKQSKRDRIQQLIREKSAADAFGVAAMQENQQLRQRLAELSRTAPGETPEAAQERMISKAVTAAQAEQSGRTAQMAQQRVADLSKQAWDEHISDARAKYADFDAVAHNPNLTITPIMAETMREEDNGGEIAYYLGKNPQEAERIARLGNAAQVRELTNMAETMREEAAKPAATATKAPPPGQTLTGGSGGAGHKDPETMTFEEYRTWRTK